MTDEERIDAADRRYIKAMHGVQSAVAFEIQRDPPGALGPTGGSSASPKHLRTGVNSAMVTDAALANLLIKKGLISLVEYHEELAAAAEVELGKFNDRHAPLSFG